MFYGFFFFFYILYYSTQEILVVLHWLYTKNTRSCYSSGAGGGLGVKSSSNHSYKYFCGAGALVMATGQITVTILRNNYFTPALSNNLRHDVEENTVKVTMCVWQKKKKKP